MFPPPSTFSYWQLFFFRTVICSGSSHHPDAMSWIRELDAVQTVDDLTSQSITGNQQSHFEMLDAKVATALKKILTITHFMKKVILEEQKAQKASRFIR